MSEQKPGMVFLATDVMDASSSSLAGCFHNRSPLLRKEVGTQSTKWEEMEPWIIWPNLRGTILGQMVIFSSEPKRALLIPQESSSPRTRLWQRVCRAARSLELPLQAEARLKSFLGKQITLIIIVCVCVSLSHIHTPHIFYCIQHHSL